MNAPDFSHALKLSLESHMKNFSDAMSVAGSRCWTGGGKNKKYKIKKFKRVRELGQRFQQVRKKGTEAAVAETTICCCVTTVPAVTSSNWPKQILTNLPERDNTFCFLYAQIIQIFFFFLLIKKLHKKLETLVSKLHCSLETEIRLKMGRP